MSKAIVFDMDGILFDTESLILTIWEELFTGQYPDIEEVLKKCIGTNEEKTNEIIENHYGSSFNLNEKKQQVRKRFFKYIEENGMPMKKGVYELLAYLKEAQYKIGLASSTKLETVQKELEGAHINQYFEVIVGGDMVSVSKPEPEIYLLACEKLGVNPKETLAIEDSLNGIKSAYSAGMKAIMVPDLVQPTEEIEKMLYQKFESLLEVRNYLAAKKEE